MKWSGVLGVVRLPVVVGPTAAGKSALVMDVATSLSVTLVSADSRQLYAGFDIGTAKPTAAERQRVPHVGIDVAEPGDRWNAARWADDASRGIEAALAASRLPVVIGGTGLYVRALFAPLFDEPPLDPVARDALGAELEGLPIEALRARVAQLDPERAHLGRTQLLRSIEVATLTGTPLSAWHRDRARVPRYHPVYLVVDRGVELANRIARRVDAMFDAGWLDEVRGLRDRIPDAAPAWNATGYREVRDVVEGVRGLDAVRQEVIIRTRQYAKRQRTWFRHQLPALDVTRVDLETFEGREVVATWWHQWQEET
ncbi:MAG: tRNA (adenosine(37)-N6)-dimethylallyltransferase MiaA [Gemmatimonadetes bacterium]|nr:tRNA (adenosine(37)-N6)-dimethylallyltransferase MiaA [Gemmatimonadota bacterium]